MKAGRFDFVMARPSDYPARGMRNYGYHYVAHAKPDGQCLIVVPKNSTLNTLADAKGKRWVLPEKAAYMTKFCNAELRDQGIDLATEKVTYVREQSTIGSYLETALPTSAAPRPIRAWPRSGKRTAAASCTRAWRSPTFRWWRTNASSPSRSRPSRTSCWHCPAARPARMCSSA
jgi:phosphonate transport system substrate-binding protein